MALFGRTQSPIVEFWKWWRASGADAFARAVESGTHAGLPHQLARRINAIHPDLQWETAAGTRARHLLVVTSGGVPELRSTAERWLLGAPALSTDWEYSSVRRADPNVLDHKLEFAGTPLALADVCFRLMVDEPRQKVDVISHHPAYVGLSDEAQGQVTFLVLDWLLGEDDVTRWIGEVGWTSEAPTDGLPPDALPETVAALAQRFVEPAWVLLEGRTPKGAAQIASAIRPLRWIDHLLMDQHIGVTMTYPEANDEGLPTPGSLDWLRSIEDGLMALIGEWSVLVAHETGDGQRLLHVYTAPETDVADQVVKWAEHIPLVGIEINLDPGWRRVQHLA